jgi:hypothetical protein
VEEYIQKCEMTLRELDELYSHLVNSAEISDRLSLRKLFAQQVENSNSALNRARGLLAEGMLLTTLINLNNCHCNLRNRAAIMVFFLLEIYMGSH